MKNTELTYCIRCSLATNVPGIKFDRKGVCNYCRLHDKLERMFPERELAVILKKIKDRGKEKKYDCVIGISGGRDSTYLLYKAVKDWGLQPLAVHFNEGFGNPVAGENIVKACRKLGVELRTVTSDWRETKDLKIACLKASVPEIHLSNEIGIAATLYSIAHNEGIKFILIACSFRTEGIKPLSWSFFDGDYLRSIHKKFGKVKLRRWKPDDPGYNFGAKELFYYGFIKGITTINPLYYIKHVRKEAEELLKKELDWTEPGDHYFDDLYMSLLTYVRRVKNRHDMDSISDAALVRTGQIGREEGIKRAQQIRKIEDPRIINLCIKRLGLKKEEFEEIMKLPPKTFRDYQTVYNYIRPLRPVIWLFSRLDLIPKVTCDKYFNCGE